MGGAEGGTVLPSCKSGWSSPPHPPLLSLPSSDCELVALLDDDSGMELLVCNKIISLDLPVADVYKKVWLTQATPSSHVREHPPATADWCNLALSPKVCVLRTLVTVT